MVLAHNDYCPKHGWQSFLNHECDQCRRERQQAEEERWNSLTAHQKADELKKRLDYIEMINQPLG